MLLELTIRNLAIIAEVRLQAGPGLTVLTGETGAGKSIIIDALALVLGGRASPEMIRSGCDEASVEVILSLEDAPPALTAILEQNGIQAEGELILRREISRNRRGVSRINGQAVPVSLLADVGRQLVDIHAQGEHLSLLRVRRHLELVDRFGGLQVAQAAVAAQVSALHALERELDELQRDARSLAQRQDLLSYQINEIESARLSPSEEGDLRQERTLLESAVKRQEAAASAYALLAGSERRAGIADQLAQLTAQLANLAKLDPTLAADAQAAESAGYQLDDLAHTLREYRDQVEQDPQRLGRVEERLELIRALKRKYGDTLAEVLAYSNKAAVELESLNCSDERQAELVAQREVLSGELAASAKALSAARREAAARLTALVERELGELAMSKARFSVVQDWTADPEGLAVDGGHYRITSTGLDELEFYIAPNPGEAPLPLIKSASGGETSRLMLALKGALGAVDPLPTYVFDEVEAGIGGRTAAAVGQKLRRLGETHQVFCVTHLPQIAACAHQHLRAAKREAGARTISVLETLEGAERIDEIAVMLSGSTSEAARRSAQELLETSQPRRQP
ncbi:MAG: DNA repair protein RecN [Chloroflexi bacterium]|nr:DNA repair protein RecN [Chloroflexota bacterium]